VSTPGPGRSGPRRPVVITRPLAQAGPWQLALQDAGYPVVPLPLLTIDPAPDTDALRQAWTQVAGCDALMFVSANAIEGFFAQRPADCAWPDSVRAWVTGPASAQALLAAGVPRARIDAPSAHAEQLDSESLWQQVGAQVRPGFRLLIVRGGVEGGGRPSAHAGASEVRDAQHPADPGEVQRGAGRDWLAAQAGAAGARVQWLMAYVRRAPRWTAADYAAAARARDGGAIWLFSSSECVAHLDALTRSAVHPDWPHGGGASPSCWAGSVALATHPRIGQAVRALGFGTVQLVRPGLAEVLASIESIG